MIKDIRIIEPGENPVCLFCGNPIQTKFDEYYPFHECNCEDAQRDRDIQNQIAELEHQRPKEKYRIVPKNGLQKL